MTKRNAQERVRTAVRSGRLSKPDRCEECGGRGNIQGHHADYSKPLEVQWLCQDCHAECHRTEPDWLSEAQKMREVGATYREIAEQVGSTISTVWKHLNIERALELARRDNARPERKRAKREHELKRIREHERRGNCEQCGEPMGIGQREDGICRSCRHENADQRAHQVEQWWAAGDPFLVIAKRLGVSKGNLSAMFDHWRKRGYALPYRYSGTKRGDRSIPSA